MSTRSQAMRVPALADPAWRRLLMAVVALVLVAAAIGLLTRGGSGNAPVTGNDRPAAQHEVQVGGDGPYQFKVLP